MGTWEDQGFYASTNRGATDSWRAKVPVPGRIRKLIVDPRPVASVGQTIIYAATDSGIYRSVNNGGDWTLILPGDVWSFVFKIHPRDGGLHYYAGVYASGVWYANSEPSSAEDWTNLNMQGIGLPAHVPEIADTPANFDTLLVDCCAANPECAYVWITRPALIRSGDRSHTLGVYKTMSPLVSWSSAGPAPSITDGGITYALDPYQDFTCYCFAVAPNSPGNGTSDILFFGSIGYVRSIDGAATWHFPYVECHPDIRTFGFYPESHIPGHVPDFYIGNDGGIGRSTKLADGSLPFETRIPPDRLNADATLYPDEGSFFNENRGLQNNLVYVLSAIEGGLVPPYIGCVDTGLAAKNGGLGWRCVNGGDSFQLAVAAGSDGVKVWQKTNLGPLLMIAGTDVGSRHTASVVVSMDTDATSEPEPTSNFVVDSSGRAITGAATEETITHTTATVSAGTNVAIPVESTTLISNGTYVIIRLGRSFIGGSASDVTPTSFRLPNVRTEIAAGTGVRLVASIVVRVNGAGSATKISQHFTSRVISVAANPHAIPRTLACVTQGRALYKVDGALTEPGHPDWAWANMNVPGGEISSMTISNSGDVIVLMQRVVPGISDMGAVFTPLFRIRAAGVTWEPLTCTGLPSLERPMPYPWPFGKIINNPVDVSRFFTFAAGRVFSISINDADNTAEWSEVSTGLPGAVISDLWAGKLDDPAGGAPKTLLRAGIVGRGAWEADVSPGAVDASVHLYVRRHMLDHGWFRNVWDGLPNPYRPTEGVYHYQCPDIKIEVAATAAGGSYYQTDPESSGLLYSTATTPAPRISNVAFDMLRDNVGDLPPGGKVRLHVQVQNRAYTAANDVAVWVLYTHAFGGPPALNRNEDGSTFDFWGQFGTTAAMPITSRLTSASKWQQVAPPVLLQGIDVNHPKIASMIWEVPVLASGDDGHYCLAVFIHSAGRPVGEGTRMSIDEIAASNPQVGQKNVHIMTMGATGGGASGGTGSGGTGTGGSPGTGGAMDASMTVEFHNAADVEREVTLSFDMRSLPASFAPALQFTKLRTTQPIAASLSGIEKVRKPGLLELIWLWLVSLLQLIGLLKKPRITFVPTTYTTQSATTIQLPGVILPAGGFAAAKLKVRLPHPLKTGEEYHLEVQQFADGKLMGGSTFILRGPESAKPIVAKMMDEDEFREMEESEGWVPPWMAYLREHKTADKKDQQWLQ